MNDSAPIATEAQDQAALSKWARMQWWGRGYVHHEQAIETKHEAHKRHRQGVRRGYPDVTVDVPEFMSAATEHKWGSENEALVGPLHLAVELKRASLRPKRRQGLWWLAWARELEADDAWHLLPSEPKRHGLGAEQALRLEYMQRCGWETFVAYGQDEAKAWLEAQIGPRPEGR